MRVKSWKLYYRETEYKPLIDKVADTIVLWSCIGLFWLSFFGMVGETFPNFVPQEGGARLGILLWLLLLWLFYEVIIPRTSKGKIRLQILVPGIHIILFLGIWLRSRDEISRGWLSIVSTYLKVYNSYYGTSYPISNRGSLYASYTCLLLTCVLWFLLWNLAYGLKKRWILIVFPVIVPLLQLYVGMSPKGVGVSLLFVGALLMVALGTRERTLGISYRGKNKNTTFIVQNLFVKGVVVFLIMVSMLLSNVFYKDNMAELVSKKPELLKLQDDLWNRLTNFNLIEIMDVQFNREELNNNTPIYTGRNVFTVSLDESPGFSIYLKGYQGSVYEDSVWLGDYSYFSQVCKENGSKPEEAAEALLQSLYDQVPEFSVLSSTLPSGTRGMEFSIRYQQNSNIAHAPYFFDYQSMDEEYTLKGDVWLQKTFTDRTISGVCLNPSYSFISMIQDQMFGLYGGFSLDEYEWYDEVAIANNKQVPPELEAFFDAIGIETKVNKNLKNPILTADNVSIYLDSIMDYSLELDELPAGEDPIIYAMSESGEGYCMHFASAGTMILRYLGIPARYVSGYIAPASGFKLASGKYVSQVKDWNAHAWVEVYIEGLGWIPVEMTPGYTGTEERLPTEPVTENSETESESQETETESEIETESQTESESETQDIETETSKNTEKETTGTNTQTEEGGSQEGMLKWLGLKENASMGEILRQLFQKIREEHGGALKVLGLLLLATVLGCGIYTGFRRWKIHYHMVLKTAVEKKNTRRAVRYIHRRIYAYLRIRKGSFGGKFKDQEMEEYLIHAFTQVSEPEWQQYMEIAKKMHYSKEELSVEEMMHCYHCYEVVNNLFFKDQK